MKAVTSNRERKRGRPPVASNVRARTKPRAETKNIRCSLSTWDSKGSMGWRWQKLYELKRRRRRRRRRERAHGTGEGRGEVSD